MSVEDPRQLRVLRQHLLTERLLGVDAVPLPSWARQPAEAAQETQPAERRAAAQPPAAPARPQRYTPPRSASPSPAAGDQPTLLPLTGGPSAGTSGKDQPEPPRYAQPLSHEEKIQRLTDLNQQHVVGCTKCRLCERRTQTVFGEGDCDAKLMLIGEGPGELEDESGRPFVGPAGQLLNKQIQAMGLTRERVFIANVVKCRPPNNRIPTDEEAATCGPYLRQQIATVQPQVIISLGAPATKHLVNPGIGITRARGHWYRYTGLSPDGPPIPVMPTFHPSHVLRQDRGETNKETKRRVWHDLQLVMAFLGLPRQAS